MTTDLVTQARAVHRLRLQLATQKARLDAARAAFNAQHAGLIETIASTTLSLTEAEAGLRFGALQAFALDPSSKAPAPGLGIRVTQQVKYVSGEALKWAKEHGLFLRLDAVSFEAFARKNPAEVPFVELVDVPVATIATDLGAALCYHPTEEEVA